MTSHLFQRGKIPISQIHSAASVSRDDPVFASVGHGGPQCLEASQHIWEVESIVVLRTEAIWPIRHKKALDVFLLLCICIHVRRRGSSFVIQMAIEGHQLSCPVLPCWLTFWWPCRSDGGVIHKQISGPNSMGRGSYSYGQRQALSLVLSGKQIARCKPCLRANLPAGQVSVPARPM